MGYRIFDYECLNPKCGQIEEKLVTTDELDNQKCSVCGSDATKLIAAPRLDYRMGVDPDFATFGDRWARIQNQRAKQIADKKREHGD